jgi:hypothetical protein
VGRTGGGGRPGRRGARATRIPPGRCGSPAAHPSEPRGAERSAVKGARDPLRFSVAGCIFRSGTGAARAGSATSGQSPLRACEHRRAAASARNPGSPRWGGMTWCGRSKRSACLHGGPLRGRPRRTALPFFRGQDRGRGQRRRPVVQPGDLRDVPRMQEPLDVRLPGRPPFALATASRSGFAPRGRGDRSRGSRVIRSAPGLSFWRR